MPRVRRRAFAVDSDIGRAASATGPPFERADCCTRFLDALLKHGQRVAYNSSLHEEWLRHAGKFATNWYIKMVNVGLVRDDLPDQHEWLHELIAEHPQPDVHAEMRKDAPLVATAVGSDSRCASMNEAQRRQFSEIAHLDGRLDRLHWVNPERDIEAVIDWIRRGAPYRRGFTLGAFVPTR